MYSDELLDLMRVFASSRKSFASFPKSKRKSSFLSQVGKQKSQGVPCDSRFISPFLGKVWPVFSG